jgi:hypothetical protein
MNTHAKWFCRAVWLGILADWVLGIPTIFAPQKVLSLLGFRPTQDSVWTAFAALLVVLLSLFYIPGASQPYRYRFSAWLAVFARPPGVLFFLWLNPGYYPAFGLMDAFFFLIQFPLLLLTMRQQPAQGYTPLQALQARPEDPSALWLKRTLWLGILAESLCATSTSQPGPVWGRSSSPKTWSLRGAINASTSGFHVISPISQKCAEVCMPYL